MRPIEIPSSGSPLRAWDLMVLAFSIYILIALAVDLLLPISEEVSRLISGIDFFICMILLGDFIRNFRHAPNKMKFMRWGWLDLVSSIPLIEPLRLGRLARVIRLIRVLRIVRIGLTMRYLVQRRQVETSVVGIIAAFLMIVFTGSISILMVETSEDSTITTAEAAVWWSIVTITTVGYGDYFPVTTPGRIVASIVMICGIGIFSVIAGTLASMLTQLGTSTSADSTSSEVADELRRLREEIRELHNRSSKDD
jgi:voltage-gated potassium channel